MNEPQPPFKVGDRVRVVVGTSPKIKHREGVVYKINFYGEINPRWEIVISRKGHERYSWWAWKREEGVEWERIPTTDMNADDTCRELVAAYHRGDTDAALILADRIFELCGGTRSPTV